MANSETFVDIHQDAKIPEGRVITQEGIDRLIAAEEVAQKLCNFADEKFPESPRHRKVIRNFGFDILLNTTLHTFNGDNGAFPLAFPKTYPEINGLLAELITHPLPEVEFVSKNQAKTGYIAARRSTTLIPGFMVEANIISDSDGQSHSDFSLIYKPSDSGDLGATE